MVSVLILISLYCHYYIALVDSSVSNVFVLSANNMGYVVAFSTVLTIDFGRATGLVNGQSRPHGPTFDLDPYIALFNSFVIFFSVFHPSCLWIVTDALNLTLVESLVTGVVSMKHSLGPQRNDLEMLSPCGPLRSENPDIPINPLASSTSSQRNGKRNLKPGMRLSLSPTAPTFVDSGCPTDSGIGLTKFPWAEPSITLKALDLPPQPKTANALTRTSSLGSSSFVTSPGSQWRIAPGSYVAFSLDTEALAKANCLPETESWEAVANFSTGKYLGLVVSSYSEKDGAGGVMEQLSVHLVGKSAPPDGSQDCWVPIGPTSYPERTRRHLKTKTLWPWNDLLQWTTAGINLVVTTFHDSKISIALDDDDFARLEDYSGEDYARSAGRPIMENGQAVPATVWRYPRGIEPDVTKFLGELEALNE